MQVVCASLFLPGPTTPSFEENGGSSRLSWHKIQARIGGQIPSNSARTWSHSPRPRTRLRIFACNGHPPTRNRTSVHPHESIHPQDKKEPGSPAHIPANRGHGPSPNHKKLLD